MYLWSDEWVVEPDADTAGQGAAGPSRHRDAARREEDTELAECVGVPARECFTVRCRFSDFGADVVELGLESGSREVRDARIEVGAGWEGDGSPGPGDVLLRV